jgi:hypothetical protein
MSGAWQSDGRERELTGGAGAEKKRTMEYKIVTGSFPAGFAREVQSHLEAGFQLQGAPFVYGNLLCQAVTKDAPAKDAPTKSNGD